VRPCPRRQGREAPLVDFKNYNEFEQWLAGKPPEVAIALAARTALRGLPIAPVFVRGSNRSNFALSVFRAASISWSAGRYPEQATKLADYAVAATDDGMWLILVGDSEYGNAAAYAAQVVTLGGSAGAAAFTADIAASYGAYSIDGSPSVVFLRALSIDATYVDEGATASDIAGWRLWPEEPPPEIAEHWREMKRDLLASHDSVFGSSRMPVPLGGTKRSRDWDVWTDWYEARLRGDPAIAELEIARATIPNQTWKQGPAVVNAEIKRLVEEQKLSDRVTQKSAAESQAATALPTALENVPSPVSFGWTSKDTITVVLGALNWPSFPFAGGSEDHRDRLEACRVLATHLVRLLKDGRWNARREYTETLEQYVAFLPDKPGEGNILLADSRYRTIRSMFASDDLPLGLAAELKTFLEQHIGLQAYYPKIPEFYESVRTGNLEPPLPLDAFLGFARVVQQHTPTKFDFNVGESLEAAAQPVPPIAPNFAESAISESTQPVPPPDPIGEVDPEKTRRLTMASGVNELVKVLESGEKVKKGVEGWREVANDLAPYAAPIIQFLRSLVGGG
jgi:hypothetical protein